HIESQWPVSGVLSIINSNPWRILNVSIQKIFVLGNIKPLAPQIMPIQASIKSESPAQLARTVGAIKDRFHPFKRRNGPNQNCLRLARTTGDSIETIVHPINKINVG